MSAGPRASYSDQLPRISRQCAPKYGSGSAMEAQTAIRVRQHAVTDDARHAPAAPKRANWREMRATPSGQVEEIVIYLFDNVKYFYNIKKFDHSDEASISTGRRTGHASYPDSCSDPECDGRLFRTRGERDYFRDCANYSDGGAGKLAMTAGPYFSPVGALRRVTKRVRFGVAAARIRGQKLDRPAGSDTTVRRVRRRVLAFVDEGRSQRWIVKELQISRGTVAKIVKAAKRTQPLAKMLLTACVR